MKRKFFLHIFILLVLLFVITTLAVIKDSTMHRLPLYLGLYAVGGFFATLQIILYVLTHRYDEDFYTDRTIYHAIAACVLLLAYGTGLAYLAIRYGLQP